VIGDVHGCHREFERLLDLCSNHANGKPARLITLGDYVGRGPDSFGVVQLIRYRLAGDYPGFKSIINLKGNHEDMMVHTVLGSEPRLKQNWVGSNNGGEATVESYPNREVLLDDAKWLGAFGQVLNRGATESARFAIEVGRAEFGQSDLDRENLFGSAKPR
jgi:serine/threonine protein phosphatase 1